MCRIFAEVDISCEPTVLSVSDVRRRGHQAEMATSILLVDPHPEARSVYAGALRVVADPVYLAATFTQAKSLLMEARPDVLVTQVRLVEFNGIHLALWGRVRLPHLRTVIVGQSDPNLERDARASGFFYLLHDDQQAILQGTLEVMAHENPRRRWLRTRLASNLPVQVDGSPALLLDVGYGGFRIEIQDPSDVQTDTSVTLDIPALAVHAEATCRWIAPIGASGLFRCGASLSVTDMRVGSNWRAVVDALTSEGPSLVPRTSL